MQGEAERRAAWIGAIPWVPPHFQTGSQRGPQAAMRLAMLVLMLVAAGQYIALSESPVLAIVLTVLSALLAWSVPTLPALYTILWFAFTLLRGYADDLGLPEQGAAVAALDQWLGGGVTPSEWLQAALATPGGSLLDQVAIWIHFSFFVAPHLAAAALWWWGQRVVPGIFRLYLIGLAVTMAVGLVMHVLLPVAPPWMEARQPGGPVMAIERMVQGVEQEMAADSERLYKVVEDQNEVAAMPSLHMAFTALIGLVFWPIDRRLGLLGLVYAAGMGFSLIYLGEHYLVDVLAGTALALAAVIVPARATRQFSRRDSQRQAQS